ncbi:two pore calcium channel protein 1A-like [Apium graveolens]|uniref:two pore calcium channel protein 1A-like n=1 Tax=Apium graveolens TaxID=4045 RepID=UPI003D79AD99
MDTHLLLPSGESSVLRHRLPTFNRRSDAIAYGSPYEKAAALIDLAEGGRGLPEEILDDDSTFADAVKVYFFFIRFDWIWFLNHFALLYLNFLEKPSWCNQKLANSCDNRDYYFLGQLPYLNGTGSLICEGITLVILIAHTLFPISYEGFSIYWKNRLNKLKIIFLLILIADVFIYALYLSLGAFSSLPFRIAPYLRVLFFILNIRDLRETLAVLAGMIATFLNVLVLGLLFLLFSSWLAYVIFENTAQGETLFTSFGATTYHMFILFTTANNPDVWIPAYKASHWYSLIFILYVLLAVYFVTNLILAVVYDSFKGQLAKQVVSKDRIKIKILKKAFDIIDRDKIGFLHKKQCTLLLKELGRYSTLPKISEEDFDKIFYELDATHDFRIHLEEFTDICNAIAVRFQKEDSLPWLENFSFYRAPLSEKLKSFIRSPKFEYVVISVLILNLVTVVIETTLNIQDNSGQKFWEHLEFVFGWLYLLELALKVYSYGFENYWRDGQNRFDFMITMVIVIVETATFVSPKGLPFLSDGEWIRYLLIARMLRIIRLLIFVPRYKAFVATFITLIPSLMPYLGTIFCVLCMYCSVGVQVFGGLVNAENPHLAATAMADNDYLLFNFNDYPSGMVTLFNLLVTVNWQAWMQSYRVLTDSAWSYIYFVSFYLVTIPLLLNFVVAFVLEAFFAVMKMEDDKKHKDIDEGSEGKDPRRRYADTKTRTRRVDILLRHMLSSELDQHAQAQF